MRLVGSRAGAVLFLIALPLCLGNCTKSIGKNRIPVFFTELVSKSKDGVQGNFGSNRVSISKDGRWIAFASMSDNLVAGVSGTHIYRKDLLLGDVVHVSVSTAGVAGNNASANPSISDSGNLIAFQSDADNLVTGPAIDGNGSTDIFVRDVSAGTTTLISHNGAGDAATGNSINPVISRDGLFVAFQSTANDLNALDANTNNDIFRSSTAGGAVDLVSLNPTNTGPGAGFSANPSISADGRYVAFHSAANNLVANDTNAKQDVFRRDMTLTLNSSIRISVGVVDVNGNANNDSGFPSISADGDRVAFQSSATDLVANLDNNAAPDIFVRKVTDALTVLASVSPDASAGNGNSTLPAISGDGLYVAFMTGATNLVPDDTHFSVDICRRRIDALPSEEFSTVRVSVQPGGGEATPVYISQFPAISGDGSAVAFECNAFDLVPGDNNGSFDIFVRSSGP